MSPAVENVQELGFLPEPAGDIPFSGVALIIGDNRDGLILRDALTQKRGKTGIPRRGAGHLGAVGHLTRFSRVAVVLPT